MNALGGVRRKWSGAPASPRRLSSPVNSGQVAAGGRIGLVAPGAAEPEPPGPAGSLPGDPDRAA
ncbi:hypothetical protein KNE206_78460 [Kitasatospora sp. NE20-6]